MSIINITNIELKAYESKSKNLLMSSYDADCAYSQGYINGYLDGVKENEQLIEKMKCCENCKHHSLKDKSKCGCFDLLAQLECMKYRTYWELAA